MEQLLASLQKLLREIMEERLSQHPHSQEYVDRVVERTLGALSETP
ncbi:MAG: hypothetical protein FWG93_02965 [Oscillospiraceae bacterium]|nr:hypothetical protein [Oscillospiraceae bacterium]